MSGLLRVLATSLLVGLWSATASAQIFVEEARIASRAASFGVSVSVHGATAVVGAPQATSSLGQAFVFDITGAVPVLAARGWRLWHGSRASREHPGRDGSDSGRLSRRRR